MALHLKPMRLHSVPEKIGGSRFNLSTCVLGATPSPLHTDERFLAGARGGHGSGVYR
jgi:hypothetical protein